MRWDRSPALSRVAATPSADTAPVMLPPMPLTIARSRPMTRIAMTANSPTRINGTRLMRSVRTSRINPDKTRPGGTLATSRKFVGLHAESRQARPSIMAWPSNRNRWLSRPTSKVSRPAVSLTVEWRGPPVSIGPPRIRSRARATESGSARSASPIGVSIAAAAPFGPRVALAR